jgi:hypothetical protein
MTGYSFYFTNKKQIEKERFFLKIKKKPQKEDKNLQMMTKDHKLTAFLLKYCNGN